MVLTYELDRRKPSTVTEGDRVVMEIAPHNYDLTGATITGEVIEAPSERMRELIAEEGAMYVMADYAVRCEETGDVWRWHCDNGYVLGPVEDPDRPDRSDIGKMRGFFDPDD